MWKEKRIEVNYCRIISVDVLVAEAPAFRLGTLRHWLFHRETNMLSSAVLKIDNSVFIDIDKFNIWLSLDKEQVSDFRNLRTKQQILAVSHIKPSKLDDWLSARDWNGLHHAVIKKGEKRLYIDITIFNEWLLSQNQNPNFGKTVQSEPNP